MKNLSNIETEKLEDLPSRKPIRNEDRWDERCGKNIPYHHIYRWLKSNIGKKWDRVVHLFVNQDWVPTEHRTYSFLCSFVETNTFMDGDKVAYYTRWAGVWPKRVVDEQAGEVFYINPEKATLEFKPKSKQVDWQKKKKEELAKWFINLSDYNQLIKLQGIWYHVTIDKKTEYLANYPVGEPLLYDENKKEKCYYIKYNPLAPFSTLPLGVKKVQLDSKTLKEFGLVNDKK